MQNFMEIVSGKRKRGTKYGDVEPTIGYISETVKDTASDTIND